MVIYTSHLCRCLKINEKQVKQKSKIDWLTQWLPVLNYLQNIFISNFLMDSKHIKVDKYD